MNSSIFASQGGAGDAFRFLRAWLSSPLRTGALAPSRRTLAAALAAAVDPEQPGHVVELGPGTGSVTEALLRRGVPAERLVLVETNPCFCALLRDRYPSATVLSVDACRAPAILRGMSAAPVSAVVSGLPLVTFRRWRRRQLLLEWFSVGRPGMPFVQFTYFRGSPVPLASRHIAGDVSAPIWDSFYPAWVWTYRRADLAEAERLRVA